MASSPKSRWRLASARTAGTEGSTAKQSRLPSIVSFLLQRTKSTKQRRQRAAHNQSGAAFRIVGLRGVVRKQREQEADEAGLRAAEAALPGNLRKARKQIQEDAGAFHIEEEHEEAGSAVLLEEEHLYAALERGSKFDAKSQKTGYAKYHFEKEPRNRSIRLVRLEWLMKRAALVAEATEQARASGDWKAVRALALPRRQDLEDEDARRVDSLQPFLDVERLRELPLVRLPKIGDEAERLPVCAWSYCWETKDHPDPWGHTLLQFAGEIKARREQNFPTEVGIFIDFCSMHQPAFEVSRLRRHRTMLEPPSAPWCTLQPLKARGVRALCRWPPSTASRSSTLSRSRGASARRRRRSGGAAAARPRPRRTATRSSSTTRRA